MPISIGPKRTASSISGFTALLHDGHRITVVAGHRQIGFDEQGVVRLETEIQVLRTDQTADRDDHEVTSTAQIAICTTSSESRTPNRQFRSPKPSRRVLAEWNFARGAIR